MEYRFKADEWNGLNPAERVRRCLLWAVEAQEIADKAPPELTAIYEDIADQWAKLAEEIEQHSKSHPAGGTAIAEDVRDDNAQKLLRNVARDYEDMADTFARARKKRQANG